MEITYSYYIRGLEQLNDDTGTVSNVHVKITSTDGTYNIESHECISLNVEKIDNFTEYDSLTENIVLGWLEQNDDVNRVKNEHIKWIELQKNQPKPATIITDLPWS